MNERERASRRLRNAIIKYLMTSVQHENDEQALITLRDWESLPMSEFIKAKDYNIARDPLVSSETIWYLDFCQKEAERAREKKRVRELVEV